jgi:hypothetical protein
VHADASLHPAIARLHAWGIVRGALRLYREEPIRVAVSALVVLGPALLLSLLLGTVVDAGRDTWLRGRWVALGTLTAFAGFLSTLGLVIYAGLLDELVGAQIRGSRLPSITAAARSLPLGTLVVADLIVATAIGVCSALGALPGLLVICLVAVVGPAVNIERLGPIAGVRRSIGLTRRHLPTVAGAMVPAILLEFVVHHWFLHVRGTNSWFEETIVVLVLAVTVGALLGLVEVVLAYALMVRDPSSRVARELGSAAGVATR